MNYQLSEQSGQSVFGFGCGSIHAGYDAKLSENLILAAYDAGIRHFDTARMYGFGSAEAILGKVLRGRRSNVTLTTKVGILPARRDINARALYKLRAKAVQIVPALDRIVPQPPSLDPVYRCFSREMMMSSLRQSLKNLQTDYVDYLLLHEPQISDLFEEDVARFIQDALSQGLIKTWGVAANSDETVKIQKVRLGFSPIVQCTGNILETQCRGIEFGEDQTVFFHSVLANIQRIYDVVNFDPICQKQWTKLVGTDPQNRSELARLLISEVLSFNKKVKIIFSSTKVSHIRQTVLCGRDTISEEQVHGLLIFLRKCQSRGLLG